MGAVFVVASSIITAALIISFDLSTDLTIRCLGIAGILCGLFGYLIDREVDN